MNEFAREVLEGLSSNPKFISTKYFYDDEGSKIFQKIMELPAYYLTDSEYEILSNQATQIYEALDFEGHFNIIELGAGDGSKTIQFLSSLKRADISFTYIPIDISQEAIDQLQLKVKAEIPGVSLKPEMGDYFQVIERLSTKLGQSLFLFLGANIGNYQESESKDLLKLLHKLMRSGDKLMIGFDLKKNPHLIQQAYFDPSGITRSFNLNLLKRINRELNANFQVDKFDFYSHYNPVNGEVRSYLVSLENQDVCIKSLGKCVHFSKDEIIFTELSRKYSLSEIENLAKETQFTHLIHFIDKKQYFSDSLWEK